MKARDVLYALTLKVNPKIKSSGAMFTKASVGYNDGDRFTAQELLDIYNEGRFTLVNVLKSTLSDNAFAREMALAVKRADISFSFEADNYALATIPSDSIKVISLTNWLNEPLKILPNSLLPAVMDKKNPHFENTNTDFFVFIQGTKFVYYGEYVRENYPYWCTYYGLSALDLDTDIKPGTTEEIFFDDAIPTLMQICEAIANEQGAVEVNNMARMLIAQKGGR